MTGDENWVDIGSADELSGTPLRRIKTGNRELATAMRQDETAMAAKNSQGTGNK